MSGNPRPPEGNPPARTAEHPCDGSDGRPRGRAFLVARLADERVDNHALARAPGHRSWLAPGEGGAGFMDRVPCLMQCRVYFARPIVVIVGHVVLGYDGHSLQRLS